jgi:LysM repeat protein
MKSIWQVLRGSAIALASIGLLFGGFSLSLAEGGFVKAPVTPSPTFTQLPTLAAQSQSQPLAPALDTATPLPPTATATLPPPPTNCPPPAGWVGYQVQAGDTLARLASYYHVTSQALQQANCLVSADGLLPGVIIYVPRIATPTVIPCGAPAGWVTYIVQPGDTLFRLSQLYRISVADLQQANCLGASTLLHTGQALHVPPWGQLTPTPTPSATWTNTPTFPLLDTPTNTDVPTNTDIPTDTPSDTPTDLPTDTLTQPEVTP